MLILNEYCYVYIYISNYIIFAISFRYTVIRALNHPFHIHGFPFAVMGMYQPVHGQRFTRTLAESMHNSKAIPFRTLDHIPPLKDTVSIPSKGYAVVRFRATNPGKSSSFFFIQFFIHEY